MRQIPGQGAEPLSGNDFFLLIGVDVHGAKNQSSGNRRTPFANSALKSSKLIDWNRTIDFPKPA
jgi:hypothetical protein